MSLATALSSPPLPAGATDAHVHVFDPGRYAFVAERRYTPGEALVDALLGRHGAVGVQRAVLVQPSVYGDDNTCLLAALARLGLARSRGVAVVDLACVGRDRLLALHSAGVRGIRLNLEVQHETDPRRLQDLLARAGETIDLPGWSVQLHCGAALLPTVAATLPGLRVPLVLDHFAGLRAADGQTGGERLDALLALLGTGQVYVKLSAFYRASTDAPHHADLAPLARVLMRCRPDRLLWGSDWPHTGGGGSRERDPSRTEPFREVDLAASLAALQSWAAHDSALLHAILVRNPALLYGFDAADCA